MGFRVQNEQNVGTKRLAAAARAAAVGNSAGFLQLHPHTFQLILMTPSRDRAQSLATVLAIVIAPKTSGDVSKNSWGRR